MIGPVLSVLLVLFLGWRLANRRRTARLSGTTAAAPVFSVPPPARRVGSRKRELL